MDFVTYSSLWPTKSANPSRTNDYHEDCKSAGLRLRWFESITYHHFFSNASPFDFALGVRSISQQVNKARFWETRPVVAYLTNGSSGSVGMSAGKNWICSHLLKILASLRRFGRCRRVAELLVIQSVFIFHHGDDHEKAEQNATDRKRGIEIDRVGNETHSDEREGKAKKDVLQFHVEMLLKAGQGRSTSFVEQHTEFAVLATNRRFRNAARFGYQFTTTV
jgi:hypothetical protein